VEGLTYAANALKFSKISEPGLVVIGVPFYMEFERGPDGSPTENPNGEYSPVQKIEEGLWLLKYAPKMKMSIIFCNDAIAEKKDIEKGTGDTSPALFKRLLKDYMEKTGIAYKTTNELTTFTCLDGRLLVTFTSCQEQADLGGPEKVKRIENRSKAGKLQERKGGAVMCALEMPLPKEFESKPKNSMRCLVDGDSAHPVGSFIGDAAYSVLEKGNTAYLGNLKHASTTISVVGEDAGGGDDATQARVQNRKLFFSGFIVPFLFPELTTKYKYTGTIQLPVKAIRGDVDFAAAKLTTVQPNCDLGILALVCSTLNSVGGTIDSGPVTIRDNIASSTMTTSDLGAEWTKTYGPIFTSSAGLCSSLKPAEFASKPKWLTTWIENMTLDHYTALFGDKVTPEVTALFAKMKDFRTNPSILETELKPLFEKAKLL